MSGTTQNRRLIPNNTTLLPPASRYFRLSDAFNNAQGLAGAQSSGRLPLAMNAEITALQGEIATLQSQLDTLSARLSAAGIA